MKNQTPHADPDVRQERQGSRALRRRPRRPRPEPPGPSRVAGRLHQVVDAERPHRRQAHQPRPRSVSCRDARHGPRAGARERPRHRRRPRPARRLPPWGPDLRAGAGDRHRHPLRELEGPLQLGAPVARHPYDLRVPPHRVQAGRRGDHRRRHGDPHADLVVEARHGQAHPAAHRRRDEVGRRAGPPGGQPRRGRAGRGAAEERRGPEAPAGAAARRSRTPPRRRARPRFAYIEDHRPNMHGLGALVKLADPSRSLAQPTAR